MSRRPTTTKVNGRPGGFDYLAAGPGTDYTHDIVRLVVYEDETRKRVFWVGEMEDKPRTPDRLKRIARRKTATMPPLAPLAPLFPDAAPITIISRFTDILDQKDGEVIVIDDEACGLTVTTQFKYGVEIARERRVAEFAVLRDAVTYARFLTKERMRNAS